MRMETDQLDGREYPVYPIYHIAYRWPQEGEYCKDGFNGTSSTIMLREANISEVNGRAMEVAEGLAEKNNVHPRDVGIEVKISHYEEWCCHWFNHYTFDLGLSDAEVLASFERYVWRMERHNQRNQVKVGEGADAFYTDPICIMGAEDRYRWSGANDDNGDPTDPPCRCEHCVEQGVVRINH